MRRVPVLLSGIVLAAGVLLGVWLFRAGTPAPVAPTAGGRRSERSPLPAEWRTPPAWPSPVMSPRKAEVPAPAPAEAASAGEAPAASLPRGAIPNEFLLSFFNRGDRDAFIRLARSKGAEVLDAMAFGHGVRLRVRDAAQFEALLREGPTPVSSSVNYYVQVPVPPPEGQAPLTAAEYAVFGQSALSWLGLPEEYGSWGAGVVVAVLDTAIAAHPSLRAVRVESLDLLPADAAAGGGFSAHGTAVASLIAGRSDLAAGMAPAAALLGVRVMPDDGVGDAFTLARGVIEAVDRGAQVINVCLGCAGDAFILRQAVEYAQQRGAAVVAAVGNEGRDGVLYPAAYPGVVAVTGVDAERRHLDFANRGESVLLAAPGSGVAAAGGEEGYVAFTGTSAAVPFVSGAVAALLSQNPGMSAEEAVRILTGYADDAGEPGRDEAFGYGILNMGRVASRDVPGLRDMAAADIYVRPTVSAGEDPWVVVSAQNRGTEALYGVRLDVVVDGIPARRTYYNVGVGATVSHEFRVSTRRLAQGGIPVSFTAAIEGGGDANPDNDTRHGRIHVGGTEVLQKTAAARS